MENYRYAVVGAGRQGTAAGYDLAVRGDAQEVRIGDYDLAAAQNACNRINELSGTRIASPAQIDVRDKNALVSFLQGVDAFVSAVPFYLNYKIARAALIARASMCDLGGNTDIVFSELELDYEAKCSGISIVPDCGMVPGLGTSVCMRAISMVPEPQDVFMWDGGLSVNPREPWNYVLTFHFEGLINEYCGTTEFLRDGRLIDMPCFEEYEFVDFPEPIGRLEAFTTAGGTSSAPRSFQGKLRTYQNKTLRYEGHCAQWKALRDAGLFETEAVDVGGASVRPRDLLERVLDPKLRPLPEEPDVCIIRGACVGRDQEKSVRAIVDLFDYRDPATGFSAMERTTGFHAAIVASMMAHRQIPQGAIPVELAVPGIRMMQECRARGMRVTERLEPV